MRLKSKQTTQPSMAVALTSCTPYDRKIKWSVDITDEVTWRKKRTLSTWLKKLNPKCNIPGKKKDFHFFMSQFCASCAELQG